LPVGVTDTSVAESVRIPEYYIKAGFLANFARLVTWPDEFLDNSNGIITLCVIDPTVFGEALNGIEGKVVRGKKLEIATYDSSVDFDGIQILFLNTKNSHSRKVLIDKIKGKPILIVGEFPNFAQDEGMINFFSKNNRIRFEINRTRAEQVGLKISSRLLKFGKLVSSAHSN
jgi:hypothetical protein